VELSSLLWKSGGRGHRKLAIAMNPQRIITPPIREYHRNFLLVGSIIYANFVVYVYGSGIQIANQGSKVYQRVELSPNQRNELIRVTNKLNALISHPNCPMGVVYRPANSQSFPRLATYLKERRISTVELPMSF